VCVFGYGNGVFCFVLEDAAVAYKALQDKGVAVGKGEIGVGFVNYPFVLNQDFSKIFRIDKIIFFVFFVKILCGTLW